VSCEVDLLRSLNKDGIYSSALLVVAVVKTKSLGAEGSHGRLLAHFEETWLVHVAL
jgi:hypothetical protein